MSEDLIAAAADARTLLRGFRGLDRVAAALELAGTVQRTITESQLQLEKARAEVDAANAQLQPALDKVAAAEARAAQIISDAECEIVAAKLTAQNEHATIRAAVVEELEQLRAITTSELNEELAAIRTAHTEAQAVELANHNKRLDDVKAKIKALATTLGEQA